MIVGQTEEVGQSIRKARQQARFTIKELAQKVDLPQNAISKMELYGQGITLPRIKKIAETLLVPVGQLLQTPSLTDMEGAIARRPGNHFLELPVFDQILRESPERMADSATRRLLLPALTPLDDVSRLYVWGVQAEWLPRELLGGDHAVIQWREKIKPQDVVGRMMVGYHRDGHVLVGRIAPNESGYHLHDGLPKGYSVACPEIEICGVVRWAWREF